MQIPFHNLDVEMTKKKVSRNDLSEALNLSYQSVHHKLHGRIEFTRKEMVAIKERLGTDLTLDELFKKED